MTASRDDVLTTVNALFAPNEVEAVLELLDTYGTQPHEAEANRVKCAILQLTEGKKARLAYFVQCAKIDYRDVLTGQRLPSMTPQEEAAWQAHADRMLGLWIAADQVQR